MKVLNELAIFSGVGGPLFAKLIGARTVCAIEINKFCQKILLQRQDEGHLEPFPIWDDVCTFNGKEWRGIIDIVSGGFPCQPFSSAAHGRNNAADFWPEMFRVIKEVEPKFILAENVSEKAISKSAYDLSQIGYKTSITKASCADMGAPHRRNRFFVIANSNTNGESIINVNEKAQILSRIPELAWWEEDISRNLGMVNGLANRLDRLQAIGNGYCPGVAASVFSANLNERNS